MGEQGSRPSLRRQPLCAQAQRPGNVVARRLRSTRWRRNAQRQRLRHASEALDEAQRNGRTIEHIQRVEASASAHDELTDLLASGAEIRKFLEKMSNRIGGAVLLYDDEFRIHEEFVSSAYKSVLAGELRAGRIDLALLINANAQSRHTGRSVIMLERGNEQCRTIALHGGDDAATVW